MQYAKIKYNKYFNENAYKEIVKMLDEIKKENKIVGVKQCLKAVKEKRANHVLIAIDADKRVVSKLEQLCEQQELQITYVNTMKELGKAAGIDVGASTIVIVKE